ncbi:hypothetical protein SCLCIDRAFT_830948 [Scleroderma citrinum Foug A]|uniref:Uncharacterized protein n=1 Tax=Scleroderma citrinum Foug A TaxID=1036808 RepID=A0A0C3A6I1_9AGAM|nr:hypothetical protein SCLCIDRAFT_830948 [Scleroderma citrinum Foug A]
MGAVVDLSCSNTGIKYEGELARHTRYVRVLHLSGHLRAWYKLDCGRVHGFGHHFRLQARETRRGHARSRSLRLHLQCNHNIHIVGFASDDTRISLSKLTISSSLCMIITQGLSMTLRSQRFAQVQQAK